MNIAGRKGNFTAIDYLAFCFWKWRVKRIMARRGWPKVLIRTADWNAWSTYFFECYSPIHAVEEEEHYASE